VAGVERGFFAGGTLYDPCTTRIESR
jgi:hypothetical protein